MKKIIMNGANTHIMSIKIDTAFNYFEKYNKARNLAQATITAYYKNYAYFNEFLKHYKEKTGIDIKDCNQVTEDLIIDYINFMLDEKDIKKTTINTRITHIKAFFMYCFEHAYMKYFKISKLKLQKELKELYSDNDMQLLLKKPNLEVCCFEDYRNWVVANFTYATALRLRSIVNIKIKDISFQSKQIFIGHLKNKKTVFLPLGEMMADILKEYLSYRQRRARRLLVL